MVRFVFCICNTKRHTLSKNLFCLFTLYNEIRNNCDAVTCLTVRVCSLYKRQLLELEKPTIHAQVCMNDYRFYIFPVKIYFQ